MKDRVFKAVWVDSRGAMWSLMKGQRGFFSLGSKYSGNGMKPMRYHANDVTHAPTKGHPYLFAFASVATAVGFVNIEFNSKRMASHNTIGMLFPCPDPHRPDKKFNKGHVEIWEAEAEQYHPIQLEKPASTVTVIDDTFMDWYVSQNMPTGSLMCKSIRLVAKVTNLF